MTNTANSTQTFSYFQPGIPPTFDTISAELRERSQWVVWKLETGKHGKLTKIPYNARTGAKASSTNAKTWSTFEEAVKAYDTERWSGVGYVFSPDDPYFGLDLDHVITEGGMLPQEVRTILTRFPGAYVERSQSGTGLHIIGKGHVGLRHKATQLGGWAIELYDRGRFFALTGDVWTAEVV